MNGFGISMVMSAPFVGLVGCAAIVLRLRADAHQARVAINSEVSGVIHA